MLNFYLYGVTSVSLGAAYAAAIYMASGLMPYLFGGETDADTRRSIASGIGIMVAAFPLWWVHWRWLRQQFKDATSGEIAFHRFFLFTIVCLSAMAILVSGSLTVTGLMNMALDILGNRPANVSSVGVALFTFGLSLGIWIHHWAQFRGGRGELLPSAPRDHGMAKAGG